MDFLNALGLPGDCPTDHIPTTLAGSSKPVVTRIVAYPDAHLIADKLCRLERYCASPLRLEARPVGGSGLSLALHPEPAPADLETRCAILHGLLLRAGFDGVSSSGAGLTWRQAPEPVGLDTGGSPRLSDHLLRLIAADPARAWRLQEAAAELGVSSRSLQRYLLAEGSTFSTALRQARTKSAASLLRTSRISLAEIGFCCGYADQAHFQREFRAVSGATPRHFRAGEGQLQKTARA